MEQPHQVTLFRKLPGGSRPRTREVKIEHTFLQDQPLGDDTEKDTGIHLVNF